LPLSPPSPLKAPAIRCATPGRCGAGAVGAGGAAGLGDLRQLGLRRQQPQVLDEPLRQGVRVRIALQVANRVGAPDRVRLAEQVVAQPDLGIRIGAPDLLQGRTRPRADLLGADAEQGTDVLVALPPFEEELEHGALFVRERHGRGSVGERRPV
jgi:hypothetical protein